MPNCFTVAPKSLYTSIVEEPVIAHPPITLGGVAEGLMRLVSGLLVKRAAGQGQPDGVDGAHLTTTTGFNG